MGQEACWHAPVEMRAGGVQGRRAGRQVVESVCRKGCWRVLAPQEVCWLSTFRLCALQWQGEHGKWQAPLNFSLPGLPPIGGDTGRTVGW